ncbi:MAG: M3 family metallopeptidase [Bacteroidaceae bacterium]|nr:M3 family metallopeptidase [Bacteroidaceae bacterium]
MQDSNTYTNSVNPFTTDYNTPFDSIPFDRIELSHFIPAIKEGIRREEESIKEICSNVDEPTFENTIVEFERSGTMLGDVLCAFEALHNARSYDEIMEVSEEIHKLYTHHRNNITLNKVLFARIKHVYEKPHDTLTKEQQRLLQETYTMFVRSGANLNDKERDEYRELCQQLSSLSLKFQENVIKDTDAFTLHLTDEKDIAGLPQDLIESAALTAQEQKKDGWVFTLHRPSYIPFITFCRNRELRRQMYMAYSTLGAKGNAYDNREIVIRSVNARLRLANLLGYNTYSDYILDERMAQNSDAVFSLLGKLTWAYLPAAKKEMEEIKSFAKRNEGNDFEFMPWDFAFYSERLKEEKYNLSDEMTRPYFNLEQAIYGAFYLATRLYGITFRLNNEVSTFHPDVKVWEVLDYDGSFLALLYCDFYARKGKHAGAWMDSLKPQYHDVNGKDHRPHVTLSTNYRKPQPDRPTLLTFDELNTLLHEFGHCLHGIMSNVTYATLCSPNVLWDFVEMPSQIMENFLIEEEFLKAFAFHHKTGEVIPSHLLEKIRKSITFQAAYQCVRQTGLGLVDQAWHNRNKPFEGDIIEYEHMATAALRLMPVIEGTAITPQFGHIMSGGYSAGYYSYKWAEMLDADAFSRFKEEGIMSMKVAQSFRDEILSKGDTEHPMELYLRFRGRKPQIDALLKRDGIC